MMLMAGRAAIAFLHSWRARYRQVICAMCTCRDQPVPLEVVFLSFEELVGCEFEDLQRFGFDLKDRDRLKLEGACPGVEFTPFTAARDVWTWYNLSRTEQKLLFAVGRYIVDKKRGRLQEALGWRPPEPREGKRNPTTSSAGAPP